MQLSSLESLRDEKRKWRKHGNLFFPFFHPRPRLKSEFHFKSFFFFVGMSMKNKKRKMFTEIIPCKILELFAYNLASSYGKKSLQQISHHPLESLVQIVIKDEHKKRFPIFQHLSQRAIHFQQRKCSEKKR